jgi:hypothetical protein
MRTTLALDDDAIELIKAFARKRHLSFGRAASELIRRGVSFQLGTTNLNGFPVFNVPDGFPVITTEQVRELSEEE